MLGKIGFKLILAVGISITIIISIFAFVTIQSQSEILLAEIEHNNSQLGETVKSSTKFDMLLNNRDHLHKIINSIGNDPSILDVRVFNKEGSVIYSSDPDQIGLMVDKKGEACFTCHINDKPIEKLSIADRTRIFSTDSYRVMGTINPVYNEPSCYEASCHAHSKDQTVLGVIDITESLSEIDGKIAYAKLKMLIFALIAMIAISSVLSYFVRIWIDKPVRELVEATKNVGSGNLNYTIQNESDDELGILARSFNNMTKKLTEARLQLFQSDKMASLGRLAAGVAHEINNPLTGILTYSSFLLKRIPKTSEFHDDLEVIVRETKRSREIVKGLLDFARQSVPKKNYSQISSIIDRSVTVIENQLALNQTRLIRRFAENLPDAYVDANQMQQVIINLIVNAIHASKKAGSAITISTQLISLPPFGITQIKNALCTKGHNLLDQEIKVKSMPTIKLQARTEGKEGYINIDPIYGKNRNHYGIKIRPNASLEISCPKCNVSLLDKKTKCQKCGGAVYFFETPGKGRLQGCAVKGCDWQNWQDIENEGQKEYIEIQVADTGCGIPEENLAKIFDPFFTTKGQKGTGLGLAVIWGIIDNHNGRITVESTVDQGTTFTIRLPIAKE